MSEAWLWTAVCLLGAYHGVNPAMGWLFAVALGLQERRRARVLEALLPIALGHLVAIGLVVALVGGIGLFAAPRLLRIGGAAVLVIFGIARLLKPGAHPRWVGMRVSSRELATWSLLMASGHGAGLMLFPLLMEMAPVHHQAHGGFDVGWSAGVLVEGVAVALVHTAAMLLVMGLVATLVYEKLGLTILRSSWVNLDLIWAVALVGAGLLSLAI